MITGAATGIGEAVARLFGAEGAHLFLLDRDEAGCRAVADSLGSAFAFGGDVRQAASFTSVAAAAMDRFHRIDILINNAGIYPRQTFLDMTEQQWDEMQDINLKSMFHSMQAVLPHMVKQQWGHVLNMCPRLSNEPSPGRVGYMISKLGMARLAIGLAAEHRKDNIAGNALWPRTIIESQASINLGMADRSQWRTPEIVCDASLAILAQEPRTSSGRQWIDEEALSELAGITNFDHYWCEGKPPANPVYIDKW